MMFSPSKTTAKAMALVLLVAGALFLAACGGSGDDADVEEPTADEVATAEKVDSAEQPSEHAGMMDEQVQAEDAAAKEKRPTERRLGREVSVDVGEMYFDVEPAVVKAGTVTVRMNNEGMIEHDVASVDQTHMAPHEMPMAHDGTPDIDKEASTIHMHAGPGEVVAKEVELEPGEYVLVCTFPGHYKAGQAASLRVIE